MGDFIVEGASKSRGDFTGEGALQSWGDFTVKEHQRSRAPYRFVILYVRRSDKQSEYDERNTYRRF
jgi:hypothetical protein